MSRAYIQCAQCEVMPAVPDAKLPAELLVIMCTVKADGSEGVAVITRKLEGE